MVHQCVQNKLNVNSYDIDVIITYVRYFIMTIVAYLRKRPTRSFGFWSPSDLKIILKLINEKR